VRSGTETRARLFAFALLLIAACPLPAVAAQESSAPRPAASAPDAAAIARALATVKADPNLTTSRTIKTLKWKGVAGPQSGGTPPWLEWLVGLFRWFDQAARAVVWCVAALLAGLLGVYIYRMVQARVARPVAGEFSAPTHVHDLDIRPESLPDDVGAAARHLWDRGEHRAALALLYRGLLSRLAHAHRVPIRDSTTEGDCLALASAHLDGGRHEYVSRLVRVWQRTVYAHEPANTPIVHALCDGFAPALDAPPAEAGA
jgi:hypothetical protein